MNEKTQAAWKQIQVIIKDLFDDEVEKVYEWLEQEVLERQHAVWIKKQPEYENDD